MKWFYLKSASDVVSGRHMIVAEVLERWSLAVDELSQRVLYIGILPLHAHQPNLYPGSEN